MGRTLSVDRETEQPAANSESDMCFLLIDTARVFRQAIELSVVDNPHGLTPGAIRALGSVIRYRGEGLRVIAGRMDIEPMTLHSQIDRLEEIGLVERRDDPTDRRKKPIFPTAKAIQVMSDLDPSFDHLYQTMTQDIPKEEMDRLAAILTRMRANLSTDPGITAPFTLLPVEPKAF